MTSSYLLLRSSYKHLISHQGALNDLILKIKQYASTTITTVAYRYIWLNSIEYILRNCHPHPTVMSTVMAYSSKISNCCKGGLNDPILKIKLCASTTTTTVVLWNISLNSTIWFLRNCCPHPT